MFPNTSGSQAEAVCLAQCENIFPFSFSFFQEQYEFCYHALQEYLDSRNTYVDCF